MQTRELWGERLLLRAARQVDAADLLRVYGDASLFRYDASTPITDIDALMEHLVQQQAWRRRMGLPPIMALEAVDSGKLIGTIQFNRIEHSCGEIGYRLATRYQHQGYMREAVRIFLRYGFSTLRLERMEARYAAKNHASEQLLRQLHFHYEGCLRRAIRLADGSLHDMVICSMLKAEWEKEYNTEAKNRTNKT